MSDNAPTGLTGSVNVPFDAFDPPLTAAQGEKVQEIINESIRRERELADERVAKLSQEFPREEGDFIILGPEIFTSKDGKVISWKGENFVPQTIAQVDPHPPLRSYMDGEKVEVVKDGDWLQGFIQDRDKVSGYLHVHTRRGPVTIASRTSIKRLTS